MQQIIFFVILAHLLLIGFLLYVPTPSPLPLPARIAVKTVSLRSETTVTAPTSAPPQKSASKSKSAATVTTKKSSPGSKAPSSGVAKAKQALTASKAPSSGVAKAKQALAALNLSPSPQPAEKEGIGALSIEGLEGDPYISELVAKLQQSMRLPEFGEVVVELTLENSGKVIHLHIKESKSFANKAYVEKTLPSLKFPLFQGSLKHETTHTFIFVLNSVVGNGF